MQHAVIFVYLKHKMFGHLFQMLSSFSIVVFVFVSKQEMESFPCADIVSYFLLLLLVHD